MLFRSHTLSSFDHGVYSESLTPLACCPWWTAGIDDEGWSGPDQAGADGEALGQRQMWGWGEGAPPRHCDGGGWSQNTGLEDKQSRLLNVPNHLKAVTCFCSKQIKSRYLATSFCFDSFIQSESIEKNKMFFIFAVCNLQYIVFNRHGVCLFFRVLVLDILKMLLYYLNSRIK